jgi:hypothetical protein
MKASKCDVYYKSCHSFPVDTSKLGHNAQRETKNIPLDFTVLPKQLSSARIQCDLISIAHQGAW